MTPKSISKRIALDRLNLTKELIAEIRSLPLGSWNISFRIGETPGPLSHACAEASSPFSI